MQQNHNDDKVSTLWVFGYGSLCWHPGFEYGDSAVGHIEGFARRFWQGNTTHRGTPDKPGRVATLMEEKNSLTHGKAFKVPDEAALDYLMNRECRLGGYKTHVTMFFPRDVSRDPFPVLVYMATPSSQHWLGPAPIAEIAEQVVTCSGNTGHNVEYVLRLSIWFREEMPDVHDDHLFGLEDLLRAIIAERRLCLRTLMGEADSTKAAVGEQPSAKADDQAVAAKERSNSFAFAANVDRTKLRCLKV